MAIIKYSAVVAAASGKAGGVVFARNKTGAYIRTWVNPINPNTAKQQSTRNAFATLVAEWRNLSKANQQLWEDMTPQYPYVNRLGEASEYSGQQLYIHLNMNLMIVGTTPLVAPLVPETFSVIATLDLTMELTAGVLTDGSLDLSGDGLATEAVIVNITTGLSGGITKPAKGLFRQVFIETNASTDTSYDFTTEYIALYGSPAVGVGIFCDAFLINKNTGQRLNLGREFKAVTTV